MAGGITDSKDTSLSKLQMLKDREAPWKSMGLQRVRCDLATEHMYNKRQKNNYWDKGGEQLTMLTDEAKLSFKYTEPMYCQAPTSETLANMTDYVPF